MTPPRRFPDENEEIDPIPERLEQERLRRVRRLITACAGSGGLLLAIAAVGLAGVGPLAS
jgi:hypothetical protein